MDKKLFLIALSFLSSIVLYAQKLSVVVNYVTADSKANDNNINYQPGQILNWDDFKGKPVTGSDAAALTSAGFGVKLMFRRVENTSTLTISVNCSFSKKDSWVMAGNKTAYILNHEQKHFDIAYINTLLFIQKLREANFTNTNYAGVIEKIYNETAANMSRVQDQYDRETSHSRIPDKQAQWNDQINKELSLLVKE